MASSVVPLLAAETESGSRPEESEAKEVERLGGPDLRACSFQGVTPGQTSVDDALRSLGMPAEEAQADDQRVLVYRIAPFEKVELVVEDAIVASVVLHFMKPASPTQIELELKLKDIVAVPIVDDTGQLLGRCYPERGVLLNFDSASESRRAAQVVLEPLTAEPFVLRARNDRGHHYEKNLADLEIARQLDPTDNLAVRLTAEVYAKTGQTKLALETIEQALQLQPANSELMLRQAELLAQLDRLDDARAKVRGVVNDQPDDPVVRARGQKLWGDLLSQGATPDYAGAIEQHLAAIKLVAPSATDKRLALRIAAKELLVELFLASAYDIAAGTWQNKAETTTKWLTSARELADSLIGQDGGDELWRLRVTMGTLSAYAELETAEAPDSLVNTVVREIQRLTDGSGDALFARELELLRVRALFDAASIAHRRERPSQAREFASQGVKSFESWTGTRELGPQERYLIGRLYFFIGSDQAVAEQNHAAAVRSYVKARRYLSAEPPAFSARDLGRHGERLVSMGASYFENGERDLGIKLTREGLERMQRAAEMGLIDADLLSLPYSNLAAMSRAEGKTQEAKEFAELSARNTGKVKTAKRR